MATFLAIEILGNSIMTTQQNQIQVDSEAVTATTAWANQLVQACNSCAQEMSNIVGQANNGSSNASSNVSEATQVATTVNTEMSGAQKAASSIGGTFTNLVSGPDNQNMKTDGSVGNLLLQNMNKTASLLSSGYSAGAGA